jgi:hypothetical protein
VNPLPLTVLRYTLYPATVDVLASHDRRTECVGGGGAAVVTFTTVESDLVGSALLTAVTVSVPAFDGAVYKPEALTWPNTTFHVTLLFVVVPCTVALNVSVPDVIEEAVVGETETDVTADEDATGFALTAAELALSPPLFTAETAK